MHPSLLKSLEPDKPPLRIGLLLDSPMLSQVFAEVTRQIVSCDFAKLDLLIFNAGSNDGILAPMPANRSKLRVLVDNFRIPYLRRRFLYSLYERWDRGNSNPKTEPTREVDCAALLDGVESIDVVPITRKFVQRFPPEAIAQIRARNLDVLIRFGFNILRGDILSCAKYGMWSYHHGDNDYYRGGPAHFWEVYEKHPISGVILQILTEELDGGKVLAKGFFATTPGLSQVRNRVAPFWGSSTFMIQKLRELHGRGWETVEKGCWPRTEYLGKKKIYRAPTNWEMTRWLAPEVTGRALKRIAGRIGRTFGRKDKVFYWRLAVRVGSKPLGQSQLAPGGSENELPGQEDRQGFRWLDSPRGHFYADPFLFEHGGKQWLFFEDFVYSENRGKIACAPIEGGRLGDVVQVLDKTYHLSFPCVFKDCEAVYMIPESKTASRVDLFRAVEFPHRWELVRTLYNGPAVDTSVWQKNGVWYFFTGLVELRGGAVQFWLFCSDSPDGEWRPHPASPISTDVRSSRNAGAIFERDGRLFRPSQDCSITYGRRFTLNEIVTLTPDEFQEKPVVTMEPDWAENLEGTHSYAQSGGIEVIDGSEFRSVSDIE